VIRAALAEHLRLDAEELLGAPLSYAEARPYSPDSEH
jgi:hypothetical protein